MLYNKSVNLLLWYKESHRQLPWRFTKDPYAIWISEVMLQQTTSTAVIPYYERFLAKFPSVEALAQAPLESVIESWAGLGYYSRARNLHKASQEICNKGSFPNSYLELLKLPGFGPYTSRAVASFAFNEVVGVLDGNVIRVLCRAFNLKIKWWTPKGRTELQNWSDKLVKASDSPSDLNQAMMELGATICVPKNPKCGICPWVASCQLKKNQVAPEERPLAKPKKAMEVWEWHPELIRNKNKILLVKDERIPVFKKQWMMPGRMLKKVKKPKNFYCLHTITHHKIYVQRPRQARKISQQAKSLETKWVLESELQKWNPSSLVQKVLRGSGRDTQKGKRNL